MRYVVDRIEENFAVCENSETGDMINFNLIEIPFIVKEGDVIIYENDEWEKGIYDDGTEERIKQKMENLWE